MAEVEAVTQFVVTEQNAVSEVLRRQRVLASVESQERADQAHRKNLGLPPTSEPPKLPRHMELAPEVALELSLMTPEEFTVQRKAGTLPAAVVESMAVLPTPARDALTLIEFVNCDRRLVAPAMSHPMLLDGNSQFWSPISDLLGMYDLVRVIAPDRSWFAMFVVTAAGENYADARLLNHVFIDPPQARGYDWLPPTHELIQVGPESPVPGFAIRRKSDGQLMLSSGLPFREVEMARRHWKDHATNRQDKR